jgi:hypothetical protein
MTRQELINRFLEDVSSKTPDELVDCFIAFKNSGGTQTDAINIIHELLTHFKDGQLEYDKVLDVSDCVTGWCLPQYRIWD